jgi:hypothetical protein
VDATLTLLEHGPVAVVHCAKAAAAGPEEHACAQPGLTVKGQSRLNHSLGRGDHRELREAVEERKLLAIKAGSRVEIPDLRANANVEPVRVADV